MKGIEPSLPEGFTIGEKPDSIRDEIRTRWWTTFEGKNYREIIFPDSDEVPAIPIPDARLPAGHLGYPIDAPPVFVGHYTQSADKKPEPITANIACVDYSVVRGGPPVAYRFQGESELTENHFVTSD